MKTSKLLAVILLSVLVLPGSALAYLDPGSTSMIWQLVLSVLAGALVFFKFFWKKLTSFFKPNSEKKYSPEHTDDGP